MINKIYKDKKGLQLKSAFFAVLMVGLIITATGFWVDGWNDQYGSGLTYDLQEYDKTSNIESQANIQQGRLSANDADPGTDFEASTFRAAYGIITNILSPFQTVFGDGGMIDSVTERFGIPDYVRIFIITIMGLAFIMAIVAIVFRLPRSTA